MPGNAQLSTLRNTRFTSTVKIKWGGNSPVYTNTNVPAGCPGCRVGDPLYLNVPGGNFNIPGNSPAGDGGIADSVFAAFQGLYGLSIAIDQGGTPRPFGPAWDMGAYEYHLAGMTIGDASVTEGDSGAVTLNVPVVLSQTGSQTVTVGYSTGNGTAVGGTDYTATSGTLTFPVGTFTRNIPVTVLPDLVDEDNETFLVRLSTPVGTVVLDGTATATIVDNDPLPAISVGDCARPDGNSGTTTCNFGVTLSNPSSKVVTVNYATASGTATSGSAFQAASGTLTFPPLAVGPQNVAVSIVGDTTIEDDEDFNVNLSNPVQGTLGAAQGDGVIIDDDAVPVSSNELFHGWSQVADLAAQPGPLADEDFYRLAQAARSSYEVIVDQTSGDITPGLLLERLGTDNSPVLQAGTAIGTASAVSLRWQNTTASTVTQQHLRVRTGAAGCGAACGAD